MARNGTYTRTAWKRLGRAVRTNREALGMNRAVLGYAISSSGKSIKRLEEGNVCGNTAIRPAGDYNSERYMLRRLALLEMALEQDPGWAEAVLQG